jgi:hypothetical protein
MPRPK